MTTPPCTRCGTRRRSRRLRFALPFEAGGAAHFRAFALCPACADFGLLRAFGLMTAEARVQWAAEMRPAEPNPS